MGHSQRGYGPQGHPHAPYSRRQCRTDPLQLSKSAIKNHLARGCQEQRRAGNHHTGQIYQELGCNFFLRPDAFMQCERSSLQDRDHCETGSHSGPIIRSSQMKSAVTHPLLILKKFISSLSYEGPYSYLFQPVVSIKCTKRCSQGLAI